MLGDDALKDFVLNDWQRPASTCTPFIDPHAPTTQKKRFIADGYRMLKVDRVDNRPISDRGAARDLQQSIARQPADVVVFSDFRHGIFNRQTIRELTASDARRRDAGGRQPGGQPLGQHPRLQDFDLHHARTSARRASRWATRIRSCGRWRSSSSGARGCKYLILKLGERGIIALPHARAACRASSSPSTASSDTLVDPVGAGDALLAYAALALAATGDIVIASILGSLAAAVACEHEGNVPVTPAEVTRRSTGSRGGRARSQ